MQIKNNDANYFQNPWIIGVIKLVVLGACLFFIMERLEQQAFTWSDVTLPEGFGLTLLGVSVMMVLNWYLEALRWKQSIVPFEHITIRQAWSAVLSGLALNWVLPFTSGDFLIRISSLRNKYKATAAVLLNRSIMLVLTLGMGAYGITFLLEGTEWNALLVLTMFLALGLLVFLFRRKLKQFITYFRTLGIKGHGIVALISLVRYGVFVLQFYWLLNLFLPDLPAHLVVAGIGWVFLIRSWLPLVFGGVGVREASALFFFEPYVDQLEWVLIPVSILWIINTVIPSIGGLVFVWHFRLNIAR